MTHVPFFTSHGRFVFVQNETHNFQINFNKKMDEISIRYLNQSIRFNLFYNCLMHSYIKTQRLRKVSVELFDCFGYSWRILTGQCITITCYWCTGWCGCSCKWYWYIFTVSKHSNIGNGFMKKKCPSLKKSKCFETELDQYTSLKINACQHRRRK